MTSCSFLEDKVEQDRNLDPSVNVNKIFSDHSIEQLMENRYNEQSSEQDKEQYRLDQEEADLKLVEVILNDKESKSSKIEVMMDREGQLGREETQREATEQKNKFGITKPSPNSVTAIDQNMQKI